MSSFRSDTIVDDSGSDQDDQVTPLLLLIAEAEQLSNDRQPAQERNTGSGVAHLGHGESTDDGGFTVVDQKLVVGLLGLEDEAEVGLSQDLNRRTLGVQLHPDLAI